MLTDAEMKELRHVGMEGTSIDTDVLDGFPSSIGLRTMIKTGLIVRSRLNNRQTFLRITKAGEDILAESR